MMLTAAVASISLFLVSPERELIPQLWQNPIHQPDMTWEYCDQLSAEDDAAVPNLAPGQWFWRTRCYPKGATRAEVTRMVMTVVDGTLTPMPVAEQLQFGVVMDGIQCDAMRLAFEEHDYAGFTEGQRLWGTTACVHVPVP